MSETSNASLNHQLSQYVFRSILSTVGASIYVLADSFFVAQKMGVLGVAVMNLSMPLFNVMDGMGLAFFLEWAAERCLRSIKFRTANVQRKHTRKRLSWG